MLDNTTKRRIDNARDILVGKVPDPKAQVEQITTALIYKFMFDMDQESVELGGEPAFFVGEYDQYAWSKLMDKRLGGHARLDLYVRAITSMSQNPHIPQLFRDIFKDAFLPYRDPETLNLFLKEIDVFTYDHSERLGDAFEYLLSILGSQGAAGQFRTPRHIIDFIVAAVAPTKTDTILDPACGTAGFLISAYKYILASNQDTPLTPDERQRLTENFVGYDIAPEMVRLSLVNMYLHKFPQPTIYEYDTLTSEDRWDDTFDVILANPPFMTPKGGIRPHNRFSVQTSRSEVLFVDYIVEHINPSGRAGVIIPEGIIFQSSNAYKALRQMLVAENYLWAVVSVPAGVFNPYSGVKTSILLIDKNLARRTDRILFVDVKNDGYDLGAQRHVIDQDDLPSALEILRQFQANPTLEFDTHLALTVPKTRLAEDGDFNLTAGRYREVIDYRNIALPTMPLIELCEFKNGLWKGKKEPFVEVNVIRNTNFGKNGELDLSNVAQHPVEVRQFKQRQLQSGDIILENSGGGPSQPVGRVVYFDVNDGSLYSFSNFTSRIRVVSDRVDSKYLFNVLNGIYNRGDTERLQKRTSGIRNLDKKGYQQLLIPLPPIDIQRAIVAEIESYQAIITGARQVLASYTPRIPIDPAWPTMPLGELCTIVRGSSPRPKSDLRYYGGNVPRLMVADLTRDGMYATPQIDFLTEEGATKSRPMKKGDLVMAVSGQPGLCTILTIDACIHDGFVGFRNLDNTKVLTEFAYHVLMSMRDANDSQSVGAVFRNLTTTQVAKIDVPIPTLKTQETLVAQLKHEQSLIAANQQLIEIFQSKIDAAIARVWGEEPIS